MLRAEGEEVGSKGMDETVDDRLVIGMQATEPDQRIDKKVIEFKTCTNAIVDRGGSDMYSFTTISIWNQHMQCST
ncbi:unnamed protein product [Anisakis simplex]|uniref:Uncharacterized protein n=1 Tax=Anisakis simplex TaxID=6269 RepID=A0A0M3KE13_ANISI|nr:unnamed protein product [Anisakis simplex]